MVWSEKTEIKNKGWIKKKKKKKEIAWRENRERDEKWKQKEENKKETGSK